MMRLNQWLALATGLSRRASDSAITAGQVTVNGQPAQLGQSIGESDEVALLGNTIYLAQLRYIALNKPVGYVCSRQGQGGDPTIYDLLPPEFHELKSVGRLDKDSSGLLVLTNDGQLAQRLTHPSYSKTKRYEIGLNRPLLQADRQRIEAGVELEDGLSRFNLAGQGLHWTAQLSEGRNRQIRRTFASLNYKVVRLHRKSFGNLDLDNLAPGKFRSIKPEELA